MPNEEQEHRRKRRKLPGFGNELAKAIAKSGLSDAEISRQTGISRTVLIGYKKGRTVPGASEIHSLCLVLQVSPAQLIFGKEHPFQVDPLRDELGIDSPQREAHILGVLYLMLTRGERDAILAVTQSLVEARHGKSAFDEVKAALKVMDETLAESAPDLKRAVENVFPQQRITAMQGRVEKRFAEELSSKRPSSSRTKRKRIR